MPIAGGLIAAGGSLIGGNQQANSAQNAANAGAQGSRDAINASLAFYNQNRQDNYGGMVTGNSALRRIADMYGLDYYTGQPSWGGVQSSGGDTSTHRPSTMQRMLDPGGLIWNQTSETTPMEFSAGGGSGGGNDMPGSIAHGDGETDFSSFFMTPDFLVRQQQGERAMDRRAASLGGYRSGGNDADHMTFGAQLGAEGYGSYLNTLLNLAGYGQQATGQVGASGQTFGSNIGSSAQHAGDMRASGYQNAGAARGDAWSGVGAGLGSMFGRSGWGGGGGYAPYAPTNWGGVGNSGFGSMFGG